MLKRKSNFHSVEKKNKHTERDLMYTCTCIHKPCIFIITLVYLLFSSWNITGREVKCYDYRQSEAKRLQRMK